MNTVIEQLDPMENSEVVLNMLIDEVKLYHLNEANIYVSLTQDTIVFAKKNGREYEILDRLYVKEFDFYKKLQDMSDVDLTECFYYIHQLSETSIELRYLYKKGNSFIACKTWFNNFKAVNYKSVFIVDEFLDDNVKVNLKDVLHIDHNPKKMGTLTVYFKGYGKTIEIPEPLKELNLNPKRLHSSDDLEDLSGVATVVVTGPTQCGKSVVLARIDRVLREEFGAQTVSKDLEQERNIGNPDNPADFELQLVSKTTWVLSEKQVKVGG